MNISHFQIGHSFLFPFTKGKNKNIDDYNTRSKKKTALTVRMLF